MRPNRSEAAISTFLSLSLVLSVAHYFTQMLCFTPFPSSNPSCCSEISGKLSRLSQESTSLFQSSGFSRWEKHLGLDLIMCLLVLYGMKRCHGWWICKYNMNLEICLWLVFSFILAKLSFVWRNNSPKNLNSHHVLNTHVILNSYGFISLADHKLMMAFSIQWI